MSVRWLNYVGGIPSRWIGLKFQASSFFVGLWWTIFAILYWARFWHLWRHVLDPTPSVPLKTNLRAQNMKTKSDALGTAKNESGSAKHANGTQHPRYRRKRVRERKTWKRNPTPTAPPKTSTGSQKMKTGPDALGTARNESGSAKHENGTWRPQYCPKRVWECKTW
jgi:hypothetical protein